MAFLLVLIFHVELVVGAFPGHDVLRAGAYGVQLFFLASAVTLCLSMSARQKVDRFPVAFFYLRRLFRIAPLFWLAMVFYWIFPGVMPAFWLGEFAPDGVHASYFVLTGLFLHGWLPYTFNSIVPGGWSIAVEMTFYLLFPLIFWFLATSWRRTIGCILACAMGVRVMWHFDVWLHHHVFAATKYDFVWQVFSRLWFPVELPVFLIGVLLYHLVRDESVRRLTKRRPVAVGLAGLGALLLLILFLWGEGHFMMYYLLVVLVFGGIIIVVAGEGLPESANPVIGYIGKVSYSCYLVHFAALGLTLRWFGIRVTADFPVYDAGSPWSNFFLFAKLFAVALALTVLISTVTLHLVENPGIALGRKIISRINSRSKKQLCPRP